MKIRNRILIVTALIFIVFILTFYFVYENIYSHIQKLIIDNYITDVENEMDLLEIFVLANLKKHNIPEADLKKIEAIFSNSAQKHFFEIELIDKNRKLIFSTISKNASVNLSPDKTVIIEYALKSGKRTGYINTTFSDEYLTLYSIEKHSGNEGKFILLYHLPKKLFIVPARKILNHAIILFICILIIIMLFICIKIDFIIKPIEKLNSAAISMSAGNFNVHVETKSKNEIGILTNSFNIMAGKMKELFEKNEIKNNELAVINNELMHTTEELKISNDELLNTKQKMEYLNANLEKLVCERTDELEYANKELAFRNEKLNCLTEQLQAANEELLSANEELNCANEELNIASDELKSKNEQLADKTKELELREGLFRGLFDNMTGGAEIYEVINDGLNGKDYIIKKFNKTSLKLEGKNIGDIAGKSLFDLRPNIDDSGLIEIMRKVWQTEEPAFFPVEIYKDENFSNYYEYYIFKIPSGEIVTIYNDETEIKRAEKNMYIKSMLLEAQAETTIDGILVVDDNERIVNYNKRFIELWGIPQELIDAREDAPVLNYVTSKLKNSVEFLNKVKYLYANKDEKSMDEIELFDGKVFDRYSSPLKKLGGGYYGRIWFFRDISEKKLYEKKILEQNVFLDTLINTMPLALYFKDRLGVYRTCNEKFAALFELPLEKIIGKTVFDLITPDKAEKYHLQDIELLNNKGIQIFESEIKKQHSVMNVVFYKSIIENENYELSGIVGGILDITQTKDFEKSLKKTLDELGAANWHLMQNEKEIKKKNEELNKAFIKLKELEYIINRSDVIVLATRLDKFFSVDYISDNISKFGYTPIEFYNQPDKTSKVVLPGDYERIMSEAKNFAESGIDEYILYYRIYDKNGGIHYIEDRSSVIRDSSGNISYFQGILLEITQRVKAEDEIKKQQIQLVQSGKMAALGQVVAGVAHEINNPNSLISLNTPLLGEYWQELKPVLLSEIKSNFKIGALTLNQVVTDVDRILKTLQTGSERIKIIIDSLKEFSRESEELKKDFYFIRDIISKAYLICGGSARRKVNKIEFEIADNLPALYCNLVKMEQVFINLIANASEAVGDSVNGIINIRCSLVKDEKIEIRIKDNGCGIPKPIIDKIFDPFFTTKISTGGTGLGLSIVWGIVMEHCGEISVDSLEGIGTEFIVKLPINIR